jgi:hypothetical protein
MVRYFKDLKANKISATVQTVQENADVQEDGSCPWSWILTIGGSEYTGQTAAARVRDLLISIVIDRSAWNKRISWL